MYAAQVTGKVRCLKPWRNNLGMLMCLAWFCLQGFACLPAGVCLTSTGRPVSFERATGWKVIVGDPSVRIAAFVFCNWSFVGVQL